MFLDQVHITVAGGNGGDGCVAWHREKYVDHGGPDGGDGGRGGNVLVQADSNSDTLSVYMSRKNFKAQHGERGTGKTCAGKDGEDLVLKVPPGTIVIDETDPEHPILVGDLSTVGSSVRVSRGGRGGFGNAHFVSAVRQAPDFAELGEPGEKRALRFELKLVADVGIIGFPSVGKSSLIAAISRARPKIADYPFTTLVPNLGVARIFDRDVVFCDVPGLIEGASDGKGLGHQFLRHIERCGVLIHLLDITRDDIVADYKAIRNELKKYSPTLAEKTELVVLNKSDVVNGDTKPWIDALKKKRINVQCSVSAASHQGTDDLLKLVLPIVLEGREKQFLSSDAVSNELPVLRPAEDSEKMGAFTVSRSDGVITIRGRRLEQFTSMTNFRNPGGRQRFIDVLDRVGVLRSLEPIAEPGDRVQIGTISVEEYLK